MDINFVRSKFPALKKYGLTRPDLSVNSPNPSASRDNANSTNVSDSITFILIH